MSEPRVLSVNTGSVGPLFIAQHGRTHRIPTGINKAARTGAVEVGKLGLAGDEQADLTVHGGLSKAVYAYPVEHYPFWVQQRLAVFKREEALAPGFMGENLTVCGLLETEVHVGDRLRIGAVLLEITEPRSPCYKFGAKMGFAHALKAMLQSGYTGFYLRVLETGTVEAGAAIELLPGARKETIAAINARRLKGRQKDLF